MAMELSEKIIKGAIRVAENAGFEDVERTADDDVLIARWFDDEREMDEVHFIKVYVREKSEGFGEDPTIAVSEMDELIFRNMETIAKYDSTIRFSSIIINVIGEDRAFVKLIRNAEVVRE